MTPPPLGPIPQLLLLLARLSLSAEQAQAARELCARIEDWPRLAEEAKRRFVLPLVYRHLRRLAPPNLPPEPLEQLRHQSLLTGTQTLEVANAHRQLVRELLVPLGMPYLLIKGYALAACYYDEPALRFCRDIDLLVPRKRMVELAEAAQQRGYRVWPENAPLSRRDLLAAVRYRPVLLLLTPRRVLIEIHPRIDKSGVLYDTDELLAGAEFRRIGDTLMAAPPTAEHFVFVCLHHTRHLWSHLHWLVDLDAILRHPDFSLDEVRALAARRGLSATVEACLELHRVCAGPEPWRNEALSPHGRALLNACLMNLAGDPRMVEHALRSEQSAPDFAYAWQTHTAHRLRYRVRGWFEPLRPTYANYRSWPLPLEWHWLYYFTRPFRGLRKRLGEGAWRG